MNIYICYVYKVFFPLCLGPPKEQGIIPRSLEVIFNSVGDKQYDAADLKPQLYCEVKRLTRKEMLAADKFKMMVINAGAVCSVISKYVIIDMLKN